MGDFPARRLNLGQHGLQVVRVEDGQGLWRHGLGGEAAVQALAKGRIVGAVVLERPAERRGVEGLVRGHVGGGKFEIVQFAVFTHGESPKDGGGRLHKAGLCANLQMVLKRRSRL
ncbi:hypothetical protein D3C72_1820560 [compost metagenome]